MNASLHGPRAIGDAWSSIRRILRDFSFATIKDIAGGSGLPVERLAHLQQGLHGASKGQLLDGIDGLVNELNSDARDRYVSGCIEEMLRLKPDLAESLEGVLSRVGFGLSGNIVWPLVLQLDLEVAALPQEVSENISKSLRRYRDGDFSGAITGICGAVDKLTEAIYSKADLGDHKAAAFQERVSKAFATLEQPYCAPLKAKSVSINEVKLVWENHKKAVRATAYVLGAFRREYSDTHGEQNAPPEFVQKALDCGVFIIRSFAGMIGSSKS